MALNRRGDIIWLGAKPDEPWQDITEPFELIGEDTLTYPPGTPNVAGWIKRQRTPYVSRTDLERVAPSCGVGRRNTLPIWQGGRGSIGESLEILECFDWIRSALRCLGWRETSKVYFVNPELIGLEVMPASPAAPELRSRPEAGVVVCGRRPMPEALRSLSQSQWAALVDWLQVRWRE